MIDWDLAPAGSSLMVPDDPWWSPLHMNLRYKVHMPTFGRVYAKRGEGAEKLPAKQSKVTKRILNDETSIELDYCFFGLLLYWYLCHVDELLWIAMHYCIPCFLNTHCPTILTYRSVFVCCLGLEVHHWLKALLLIGVDRYRSQGCPAYIY